MTIQELLDKKGQLANQAKEILSAADAESRDLRPDEEQRFEAIHADIEKITKQVELRRKQEAIEQSLDESQGRRTTATPPGSEHRADDRRHDTRVTVRPTRMDMLEGMRSWLLAGSDQERTSEMREAASRVGVNLDQKQFRLVLPSAALRGTSPDAIRDWEQRAQATTPGSAGGDTVADEMMRPLEIALLQFGGLRQVANVIRTTTGADLPIPTTNDTSNKGVILAQNTVVTEQDLVFGQLILESYKYSSRMIRVSVEFLQDSAINVAEVIGRQLGERIGRITNEHFTVGTGVSQPRGIITAAEIGKTGAAGQIDSVIYDDLVDLEHSVDPAYRGAGAGFMFADSTLKALKKIKVPQFSGDLQGMPLWQPGLVLGQPDTILGYRYTINQDVPAMAASARSIAFGQLDKYLVRDVRDIVLLRLDERFADFHQVAFLAFSRHDGDLLDAGTNPVKVYVNASV